MKVSPFISYAREDAEFARRLDADLRGQDVDPWLDITRIVAGADWTKVVKVAIWRASHVILLISSRSVAKEGYVQHEVREALTRLKRMPPNYNFVIPVLLNECDVPYEDLQNLQRVHMFKGWDEGVQQIVRGLYASEVNISAGTSGAKASDLMTELKNPPRVEASTSARFGQPLENRAAVYAEAIRLIANAGINDDARATATLFDRKETTDELFLTYLNLIAAKCRAAADRGGSFEHHALFAFHRDATGQIPSGVQRGLDVRQSVFESHGVLNRVHLYHISEPILDMLLVGPDRAVIAFPESPMSSRLQYGISAIGLQSVSSLGEWYANTIVSRAARLNAW